MWKEVTFLFLLRSPHLSFTWRSGLEAHKSTHSTERPYACQSCDRSFSRLSSLRQHEKTHLAVKPHQVHLSIFSSSVLLILSVNTVITVPQESRTLKSIFVSTQMKNPSNVKSAEMYDSFSYFSSLLLISRPSIIMLV